MSLFIYLFTKISDLSCESHSENLYEPNIGNIILDYILNAEKLHFNGFGIKLGTNRYSEHLILNFNIGYHYFFFFLLEQ